MEQKAPRCQLLQMADSSWLMQRLASVGVIEGMDSVAMAAAYDLRLEARMEAVLNAVSRALIS